VRNEKARPCGWASKFYDDNDDGVIYQPSTPMPPSVVSVHGGLGHCGGLHPWPGQPPSPPLTASSSSSVNCLIAFFDSVLFRSNIQTLRCDSWIDRKPATTVARLNDGSAFQNTQSAILLNENSLTRQKIL